jgi:CheY-like chemotaxis protein
VVILDIELPGLDGREAGRQIRARLGDAVLLIAYTAYDLEDLGLRLEETPFDGWLIKPADFEALLDCLNGREDWSASAGRASRQPILAGAR